MPTLGINWLNILSKASGVSYGPVLNVSNCENSVALPYDVFANGTPNGFDVIKSGAGTQAAGTADELPFAIGEKYQVAFTIVNNSGFTPAVDLMAALGSGSRSVGGAQGSYAGANVLEFESAWTGTGVVDFRNGANGDNEITNLQVRQIL